MTRSSPVLRKVTTNIKICHLLTSLKFLLTVIRSLNLLKGAQSRYFELFWALTKLLLNWRRPENNTSQRQTNAKEIITKHKGTRTVKDGEDWHGFQTISLKAFQDTQAVTLQRRHECNERSSSCRSLFCQVCLEFNHPCSGPECLVFLYQFAFILFFLI